MLRCDACLKQTDDHFALQIQGTGSITICLECERKIIDTRDTPLPLADIARELIVGSFGDTIA